MRREGEVGKHETSGMGHCNEGGKGADTEIKVARKDGVKKAGLKTSNCAGSKEMMRNKIEDRRRESGREGSCGVSPQDEQTRTHSQSGLANSLSKPKKTVCKVKYMSKIKINVIVRICFLNVL